MDVLHPAIRVSDLEEALNFYRDVLGLDVREEVTIDGVEHVFLGGESGELQLVYDPDAETPAPDRSTLDHIGFSVDDTDQMCEHITEQTDYEVISGPMEAPVGARIAFLEAPDGYVIELVDRY